MRLRRIEIANFRKLAGPVVLDELGPGLVIVSGDNEEGKSTVLAALKAAFFEHHTVGGAIREAMTPHGGGTPEIAVEFECGSRRYRLRKAFRRGGVQLECAEQRWSDDAAERMLQDILRFERRQGRGVPRPENAGLQALFWVDQATTFQGFEPVAGGRDRLASAIAAEVGVIAGGERAKTLIMLVRERVETFYTPSQQRETGALRAAGEQLRVLEAEREQLEAKRRDYEGRVDRLARLREERRRFIERDDTGRVRARLDEVRQRLAASQELERNAGLAAESLKAAAAELARHEARQRLRRDLVDEAGRLEARAREIGRRAEAAERDLDLVRQVLVAARGAEASAADALARAEQAWAGARDRLAAARLRGETQRLHEAVARVRAAQEAAGRARALVEASPATGEALARLHALQARRDEARARVEAGATRLELRPEGERRAMLNGEPVDPGSALRLTGRAELVLEGFGRLIVVPGGEDLAEREQACRAAEQALAQALARLGAATMAEAEIAAERRREAEAELRYQESAVRSLLQAFGARGADELVARLAGRRTELEALAERVPKDTALPSEAELEAEVRSREAARTEAAERLRRARTSLAEAEARATEALAAKARLDAEHRAAARQAEEVLERLALEREQIGDEQLAARVEEASLRRRAAEESHAALERQLRGIDPEGLRERLSILERELAALESEGRRFDRDIRDLEVALREAGADAWGERLAELEGEIAAAVAERRRLELEGRAWRLLLEKLQAADQEARDALVAPIGERLRPLLHRIFPGAEPVLDPERLALTHLRRDGVVEAFDHLSIGAREQLAVLVRLAFARLLKEREGEASCLILDDALVYADETRFEAMKAILQRAAADLQIVVLTCRPRDYFGLEARYLRLEDCRSDRVGG
ncbi:AAA family ATPase [Benzoatithermus flavus]|uniref:AAA family ATPase n=1 Tax=Benzoatithermus flavus TaxID=3108223 RepID=A0ABU8XLT3_9PROT